jgi:hypothetical protein
MTSERAPALRDLQRWMAARISPLAPTEAAALDEWITVPAASAPAERLDVYVNGYPARIYESLHEAFPAVAHVVGGRAFGELTERYIGRVKPRSYNLNHVGESLVAFLADDPLGADYGFLPDLAALEWRVTRAFHSFESKPIDPASLASWSMRDWETAVLHFQPAVALVRSAWPILEVWRHRETPADEIDIELEGRPQSVLVYRTGTSVHCVEVESAHAQALAGLLAGGRLGDVTRDLSEQDIEGDAVSGWFATWMRDGMIVAVSRG